MLTEEEEMILRTRAAGWTRVRQSVEFGMSLSTVDRIIKKLKLKYDEVEKYNQELPPREAQSKSL